MSESTKVSMFHAINPTSNWLFLVDDKAIICDTKDQVFALSNLVESIDDSPFGSCCIMAPNQIDVNIYGVVATGDVLSSHKIVNADYVQKNIDRANKKYWLRCVKDKVQTTKDRYDMAHAFDFFCLNTTQKGERL